MFTEASAFATIVGLLGAFTSGRQAESTADVAEFIKWLIEHNHDELAKLIEQNHNTTISIKALLNQHSSRVEAQLGELAKTTALIASRMPDLDKLAGSLVPGIELSDQALNILRQMSENKTEYFLVHGSLAGTSLIPSNGKSIEYEDDQFLHDDLATLVELQLLRLGYNSNGNEMYHFTRTGANLVKLADEKSAL